MTSVLGWLGGAERRETNRWLVLVLVCVAQFMVILDATIVNVALPSIQHGLGFSTASLQWVVNAYTLVFGGFLLLGGRASDLLGRRNLFVAGVAIFTIASFVNGIAASSGMLVVGRAFQGLGAALVSPAALAIVTTTFAEGRERAKALGIWSAIAAGGGAVGLVLGGLLTETISWRWVFFINLPIGIAAIAFAFRYIRNSIAENEPDTADVAGAVSVTGGLLVLVYAIVKAQDFGWGSGKTIGLFAAAVVLLVAFLVIELRSKAPLIRLGIFRVRSLTTANVAMLFVGSAMFASFFFVSIYVQEVLGYGALRAGLAFLPFTAGIVVGAGTAQQLIRRIGVRTVAVIGLVLASVGMLLYARTTVDGTYLAQILPPVVVMSVGMGLTFMPLTLLATTNIAGEDAGLASGLFNTSQQIGGALGLAVLSTLAASHTGDALGGLGHAPSPSERAVALVGGFHVAFEVGAALMLVALLIVVLLVRRADVERINVGEPAAASV